MSETDVVVEVYSNEAAAEVQHYTDTVLERLAAATAARIAKRELGEMPGLSLPVIVRNLKALSARAKHATALQTLPVEFFTWERPAFTLSILFVYTYLCYHPTLVACIPVLAILGLVFVPKYTQRFPIDPALLPRERPKSTEFDDVAQEELVIDKSEAVAERDLLLAARQAQASLSRLVAGLDKLEDFANGPAGFKDAQESCAIYVLLLAVLVATAIGSQFVALPPLFACSGWAIALLAHPEAKKKSQELSQMELGLLANSTLVPDLLAYLKPQFYVGDPPVTAEVEVFELQRQGLTPRMWDAVVFTPYIYTPHSALRLSQQIPPGTTSLEDVSAPRSWYFESSHKWALDKSDWWTSRGVQNVVDEHGWVYDVDAFGEKGEWRRRRWIRTSFHGSQ